MIMQNVSPAHVPDIVIYVDAITVIFEGASKGGPSMSSPVACVETGNDHGLPGLALRLIPSLISLACRLILFVANNYADKK